jgi:hypothetical protein
MRQTDVDDIKWCPRCKRDLPKQAFIPPRGAGVPTAYCTVCLSEQNKDRLFAKRCLDSGDYPIPECCQCCKRPFGNQKNLRPHFDHDHITNAFRGWLCGHCNLALGHMRDDIATAKQMVDYLTEFQKRITDEETLWKLQGIDDAGAHARRLLKELKEKKP